VLVPLVEDEPRRRHQIEHGRDDVAVEPRRRVLAELRKALLVLRPQAVYDERVGARAALLLRRRAALARRLAKRRRPGQRQHIEIELAGLVLAAILRRSSDAEIRGHGGEQCRDKRHATDHPHHWCPPINSYELVWQ
jgi:hypothetical protein